MLEIPFSATLSPVAAPAKSKFTKALLGRIALVGVLSALVSIGLGFLGPVKSLELRTLDMRFKWRKVNHVVHQQLVFVGISDQDVLKTGVGEWPWSRGIHAQVLSAFTNESYQPLGIAFNIPLPLAKEDEEGKKGDAQLGEVLKELGCVCLAGQRKEVGPAQDPERDPWLQSRVFGLEGGVAGGAFKSEHEFQAPAPPFREETHFGLINMDKDEDGVARRVPLLFREGERWVPSLVLRTAMLFHGVNMEEVVIRPGKEIVLQNSEGIKARIPIDHDQQMRINYRADIGGTNLSIASAQGMVDLASGKATGEERQNLDEVLKWAKDGVVIVGHTAQTLAAISATPLNSKTPLIAAHFNAINNIMVGDFLHELPLWATVLITLALSLIASLASQSLSALKSAIVSIVLLAIYLGTGVALFMTVSFWLPAIVPSLALLLSYGAGAVLQFTGVEKRSAKMTDAFQSYVSADLVKKRLRGASSGQPMVSSSGQDLSEMLPELQLPEDSPIIGFGKYNLLCKLGQGGMGAVFLGREKVKKAYCAVKVLNPQFSEDADATKRFMREGETMRGLVHPNLVSLFECDQIEGQYFIAMEFIEGMSVGDVVKEGKPLPLSLAFHWLKQGCEGLAYIHARTMIHRDIKPDNMMINAKMELKITDLGLAKDRSSENQSMTVTGTVMGSPHYMSPEQVNESKNVDHRADLYSMGISFFQMVTGRVPYGDKGSAAEVCLAHLNEPIPSVGLDSAEVTQAMDEFIGKMCAKNRDERFQTAEEILAAMQPWLEGCPMDDATKAAFAGLGFDDRKVAVVLEKHGVKLETIDLDVGSSIAATDVLPEAKGSTIVSPAGGDAPAPAAAAPVAPAKKRGLGLVLAIGIPVLLLIGGGLYWFLKMRGPAEEPPQVENPPARPPVKQPAPVPVVPPSETNAPPAEVTPPVTTDPATTNAAPVAVTLKTGTLVVNVEPAGATVTWGEKSAPSPATFTEVPVGKVTIKVTLEGYEDQEQEADVTEGESKTVTVTLKKREAAATPEAPAPEAATPGPAQDPAPAPPSQ